MKAFVGFAGVGGVDIALREFGFDIVGVEIDNDIAEANRANGGNVITADIREINTRDYADYNLMHFSPPCPNFSQANARRRETNLDRIFGHTMAEFVALARPEYFTLENVWSYQRSEAWAIVENALLQNGYGVDFWHLNAANYGIPQTRKRMIVIARRDGRKPQKPFPTHAKCPDMFTRVWVGWHEAIADLIPELPETNLAPWQIDRMPEEINTYLIMTGNKNRNGIDNVPGRGWLKPSSPSNTVTTRGIPRAVLVSGQYQTPNYGSKRIVQNRSADQPVWTITASEHLDTRCCFMETGRVVALTPRALARLQGFPDWVQLPTDRGLACRVIGNAVPPGLYRAILRSLGFVK